MWILKALPLCVIAIVLILILYRIGIRIYFNERHRFLRNITEDEKPINESEKEI